MSVQSGTQQKARRGRPAKVPTDPESVPAKTINLTEFKKALPLLSEYCEAKIAAADRFTDECKAIGEKANLHQSVIASYVRASVRNKLAEHRAKVEQMSLLFDEGSAPDGTAIN